MATISRASNRPTLLVRKDDLTATARELAGRISETGEVFDRGGPVRLSQPIDGGLPNIRSLNAEAVVNLAHEITKPAILGGNGEPLGQTLPARVGRLYLELIDWGLPILNGITTAPILSPNGEIHWARGFHEASGLYCTGSQSLEIPAFPTREQAEICLDLIRDYFQTFPFADAEFDKSGSCPVVNRSAPIRHDESAFLCALFTAVCRPSLPLAPGLLVTAPGISGAGTGKGQMVRAITLIAYGQQPSCFTASQRIDEFDKLLDSAIVDAMQVIFIDNMNSSPNGETLRSDKLASILTEPTVAIRRLGSTGMVRLKPITFVAITGNGLSVSEDLARRFLSVKLDAKMEDPETRPFPSGFLDRISCQRLQLLTCVLTIWRWGIQNSSALKSGKPLGSFEVWGSWVRDPLLSLGCADPIERIQATKANDPVRGRLLDIFKTWLHYHQSDPIGAFDLSDEVKALINPAAPNSRQAVTAFLQKHVGTMVAGMTLIAYEPNGQWGKNLYAISTDRPQPGTRMLPMMPMV